MPCSCRLHFKGLHVFTTGPYSAQRGDVSTVTKGKTHAGEQEHLRSLCTYKESWGNTPSGQASYSDTNGLLLTPPHDTGSANQHVKNDMNQGGGGSSGGSISDRFRTHVNTLTDELSLQAYA